MDNRVENIDNHAMAKVYARDEGHFRAGHFVEQASYRTIRARGGTTYLFMMTRAGAGVHRERTGRVNLAGGTAFIYRPGVPQDYGTSGREGMWDFYWAHFEAGGYTAAIADRICEQRGWALVRMSDASVVIEPSSASVGSAALDAIKAVVLYSGRAGHRGLAQNSLERALLLVELACRRHEVRTDPRLTRVLEAVSASPAADHSVDSLAELAGMSRSRLQHLFRATLGTTVMDAVEAERMRRAQDRLRMSDRAIAEVGRQVGYHDPLYFSRRFSRRFGMSPREWRKRAGA